MIAAITGPTGSIGCDLIQSHLDAGDSVIAIVNPKSKRKENLPESDRLTILECGLGDYQSIMGNLKCDVFYHLAWAGTGPGTRCDEDLQSKNIQYALDAVDLAHSWGAKKFIGAGSQAEYGHLDGPICSDASENPVTAYGRAKLEAGIRCKELCNDKGVGFNWARILSVYGSRDSEGSLVRYLIECISKGEPPELSPCEQTWDLLYSKDCAEALTCIAERGVDGKTYVISSNNPSPLKDMISRIRDAINPNVLLEFGSRDYYAGQTMMLCSNDTSLEEDTGFKPRYSLEEGIKDILRHRHYCRCLYLSSFDNSIDE